MPVSSRASRRAEASAVSPKSTKPPGPEPAAGRLLRPPHEEDAPLAVLPITPAATAGLKWKWKPQAGQEKTGASGRSAGPGRSAGRSGTTRTG